MVEEMFILPNSDKKWNSAHDMILDAQLGIVNISEPELERIIKSKKFDLITRFEALLLLSKLFKNNTDKAINYLSDVPDSFLKKSYIDIAKYNANPNIDIFFSIVRDIDLDNPVSFHVYTERFSVFLVPIHQLIMKYVILSINNNSAVLSEKSKRDSIPFALENIEIINPEKYLIDNAYREWII